MSTLVMKFGGAAFVSSSSFAAIADLILKRHEEYPKIAVVVSAMSDATNQLIHLAKQVHPDPPRREYDMLVTVGERISISLLAMALALAECDACSFTGSQTGIITCPRHADARIIDVRPHRIQPHLAEGRVVIVAGFQGVSQQGMITTLGRGGGDISAVALAAALGADRVEFYKDVAGVYTEDPKIDPQAAYIDEMNYARALEIASRGCKVLHPRAIKLAEQNSIPLSVQTFNPLPGQSYGGTWILDQKLARPLHPIYEKVTD